MTEQEALSYLQQIHAGGMTMGLARMERIMELLGNPHQRLKTVHIAGTNGKGSTARMIQAMGMAAGYRVGLFSSPAVTGVRDTIDVNGVAISPSDFARHITAVRERQPQMGPCGQCSEFETLTAVAFGWLSEQNTDFCVIECGLGGAEDSTNVLPPPLVAVLTSIALDHTAILGDSIEAIARQKCGIIKSPCGIVTSPSQAPAALGVIWETAAQMGLTVYQPGQHAATLIAEEWGQTRFAYGDREITLTLTGRHQIDNALTAMEVIRLLAEKGYPITKTQMTEGLFAVTMPCRQEVVGRHPLRIMDGAHNPAGIATLAASLQQFSPDGMDMLFGMLADKEVDTCLKLLAPYCHRMVCTTPQSDRALPAADLAAKAIAVDIDAIAIADPVEALQQAEQRAGEIPLLVGGSFYLGAALRPILLNTEKTAEYR